MKKIIGTIVLVLLLVWLVPWSRVRWGKIAWEPAETVSVSGEAKSLEKNQIASFTAGVMVQGMDKNKAIEELNSKTSDLIKKVKEFGVAEADIQTQGISYYQEQRGSSNPGQWQVNNSIEITLREVDRASDLAGLLANTGANNVYGPNFRMDDTKVIEKKLYDEAIKDAREKAEAIANAAGRKLGKVISVSDGAVSSNLPIYSMKNESAMGGAAPVEVGSSTVYKSLSVVFELK